MPPRVCTGARSTKFCQSIANQAPTQARPPDAPSGLAPRPRTKLATISASPATNSASASSDDLRIRMFDLLLGGSGRPRGILLVLQQPPHDLARAGFRQRVDELHDARRLVGGHVLVGLGDDVALLHLVPGVGT